VRPTDLQESYARRFGPSAQYRVAVWGVLIRFLSRWIPRESVLLDLGCGWGEFINQIKVTKKYGMDLNPDCRIKLKPEVILLAQDCSEPWTLGDEELDVIFTSNFFEHLPSKEHLRRTLAQAVRCLKPGGRLICLGPNIKFLHGYYWDFWDHHLPLTEASLAEGLELAGFVIEVLVARFLPYRMVRGFIPPLMLLRIYLRCPLLWRFVGKQFLIIATKPAPLVSRGV
jgi:SAM-dependent methyltransferase